MTDGLHCSIPILINNKRTNREVAPAGTCVNLSLLQNVHKFPESCSLFVRFCLVPNRARLTAKKE